MKQHNVLFVDLPLHSHHVLQAQENGEYASSVGFKTASLPSLLSNALNSLKARTQSTIPTSIVSYWSVLAYPSLESPSSGVCYIPWTLFPNIALNTSTRAEITAKDPYLHFLHLFDEIEALDLIWLLPSSRIASTSALSYRLVRIIRYLMDLKGVRCQILVEEGTSLPLSFTNVIASLDVPIRDRIEDISLQWSPSFPLYPQLAPFLAPLVRIPPIKAPHQLLLTNGSFLAPRTLAFHSIALIGYDRLPLLMLEGDAHLVSSVSLEGEPSLFFGDRGLVITSFLQPSKADSTHLPSWNASTYKWEYSDAASLSTGPSFLLYSYQSQLFLRQLKLTATSDKLPSLDPIRSDKHIILHNNHMDLDSVPKIDDINGISTWLSYRSGLIHATAVLDSSIMEVDMPNEEVLGTVRAWFKDANHENKSAFLNSVPPMISTLKPDLLPIKSRSISLIDKVSPISEFDELATSPLSTGSGVEEVDTFESQSSQKHSISPFSAPSPLQALNYLWERELSAFAKIDAKSQGIKLNRSRSLHSNIHGGIGDDVSTVGSESTNSEPAQTLLDAVRPNSARNSATSPDGTPVPLRKVQTSQQLRSQLLNRARGTTNSPPPARSLSSTIDSPRSSSSTSTLLSSLGPVGSTLESPRLLPPLTNPSSSSHRRTSLTPLGSPQPMQRPHELAAMKSSGSKTASSSAKPSSKLSTLSTPKISRKLPNLSPSLSSSSAGSFTKSSASFTAGSSNSSFTSASAAASKSSASLSSTNEEDNHKRLMACCRTEMGRFIPSTDKKFGDLVDRLSHICHIMLATRYEWNVIIPNSEFHQCAASQAKLLVQAYQSKQ